MSKQAFKRVRKSLSLPVCREPLPAYAWPGGCPLAYLCADGETLCADCVNREIALIDVAKRDRDTQWHVVAVDVHWEGEPETCAHCNGQIESAYGPVEESAE